MKWGLSKKESALTYKALKMQLSLSFGFDTHDISGQQIYLQSHRAPKVKHRPFVGEQFIRVPERKLYYFWSIYMAACSC